MGDVLWVNVKSKFRLSFSGCETKILILKNEMIIPKEIERIQIIHDNHLTQWADTKVSLKRILESDKNISGLN